VQAQQVQRGGVRFLAMAQPAEYCLLGNMRSPGDLPNADKARV
jgi:hypothetical protein